MTALFVLLSLLLSGSAFAFPEMSRAGYFNCSTCHVDNAGGGLLTAYGRGISGERLSMASSEKESKLLYGVAPDADWYAAGADYRTLYLNTQSNGTDSFRAIRMQADTQVAVILPHVTVVAAGGPRYPDNVPECRGCYMRLDYNGFALKVGRFLPQYGLRVPQHFISTRDDLGFGEGGERVGSEVSYAADSVEASATAYRTDDSGTVGFVGSASYYLFGQHRIGGSYRYTPQETSYGAFAVAKLPGNWFALCESDLDYRLSAPARSLSYGRLALEPLQGAVLFASADINLPDVTNYHDRTDTYGVGVQLFPRPHFDFEAFIGSQFLTNTWNYSTVAYLMGHYYL